jgi:hypothetical protein
MNRYAWDDALGDQTHSHFDFAFSELLPGEKIQFGQQKTDAWRRVRNGRLRFPRFFDYDLSLSPTVSGPTNRTLHFETRLFQHLPWFHLPEAATWACSSVVCPLPVPNLLQPAALELLNKLGPVVATGLLRDLPDAMRSLDAACQGVEVFWLPQSALPDARQTIDYERICMFLENCLKSGPASCVCCAGEPSARCAWCLKAKGWHRCQKHMFQNNLDATRLEAFRWSPNTLWDTHGHDVDVCVLDMLHRAVSPPKIQHMLDNLKQH